jgi:hypothetical protein
MKGNSLAKKRSTLQDEVDSLRNCLATLEDQLGQASYAWASVSRKETDMEAISLRYEKDVKEEKLRLQSSSTVEQELNQILHTVLRRKCGLRVDASVSTIAEDHVVSSMRKMGSLRNQAQTRAVQTGQLATSMLERAGGYQHAKVLFDRQAVDLEARIKKKADNLRVDFTAAVNLLRCERPRKRRQQSS